MPGAGNAPASLTLVTFGAGTLRCAVEPYQVAALSLASLDAPRDDEGHALPARHAGTLLGLPGPHIATGHQLRMRHPAGLFALDVGEPVALRVFPPDAIHPLPPLLAARCRLPFLRALALDPTTGLILILDWIRLPWPLP
ncbi:MAG: hypothetical protein WCP34_10370 [Pseudomonadota bacterium]